MDDKEIIKALECCSNYNYCDKCNFEPKDNKKKTVGCCLEIMKNALDLITRQQAENERLKSANDEKFCQWNMLAKKTKQYYADLYDEAKDILKAEAVKEFAERLKEKSEIVHLFSVNTGDHYMVDIDDIDSLVKEMVGD